MIVYWGYGEQKTELIWIKYGVEKEDFVLEEKVDLKNSTANFMKAKLWLPSKVKCNQRLDKFVSRFICRSFWGKISLVFLIKKIWLVRLCYCFTPYQRLWLYNGAPLVAFTTRWGYGGRILGLNPGVLTGVMKKKCIACKEPVKRQN